MSMEHLKHFIERLKSGGFGEGDWGELDVVEMYPNIQHFIVPLAVEFFWKAMKEARFSGTPQIFFRIHKGGKKTSDFVGPTSRDPLFHHFSFADLMLFVHWDLMWNDQFCHFISIFCQQHGTPIGGSASAQHACLVMLF